MEISRKLPGSIKKVSKYAVCRRLALIFSMIVPIGPSCADDRPAFYLNDMKIQACVTAQNAVRARLKDQGRVSFESCASDKFEIFLSLNDRDYRVNGYAVLLDVVPQPSTRHFFVRINHNPGSYGDWGFEVMGIEIGP